MRKMMMWLKKRMRKMMEKVMKMMMMMMRLRVAQEKEQLRMTTMRMMLKLRSKRLMCKKLLCWKSSHPSCPELVHWGRKKSWSSSSRVQHPCTHTPNCRFCRNNQDFKALPSYKIL